MTSPQSHSQLFDTQLSASNVATLLYKLLQAWLSSLNLYNSHQLQGLDIVGKTPCSTRERENPSQVRNE